MKSVSNTGGGLGETVAVIVLTGFGREIDIVRSFEAGFDAHVLKPASVDELLEVVTRSITSRCSQ